MDQERLLEEKIRRISKDVYTEQTRQSKYTVTQVPFHTHNGTDSTQINEKDIVRNVSNHTFLITDTNETIRLRNIPNLRTFSLIGFAANNASGPATQRAIMNGEAKFGRCYQFTGTGSTINIDTAVQGIPFFQCSNSLFTNQTGPAFRVAASDLYIGYVTDGTSDVVIVEIESYDNSSIVFTVTLAAGWKLQANLILS